MKHVTEHIIAGLRALDSGDMTGIDPKLLAYTPGGDMYSRELYISVPGMRDAQFQEIANAGVGSVKLARKHGKRVIIIPTAAEYGDHREGAIMRVYIAILQKHGLDARVDRQVD